MRQNQNGFSPIVVLLVILLVAVVGVGGYYVMSANKDKDTKNSAAQYSPEPVGEIADTTDKNKSTAEKDPEYQTTVDGLKYQVPSGWRYEANLMGVAGPAVISADWKQHEAFYISATGVSARFGVATDYKGKDFKDLAAELRKQEYITSSVTTTVGGLSGVKTTGGHNSYNEQYLLLSDDWGYLSVTFEGSKDNVEKNRSALEDFLATYVELNK